MCFRSETSIRLLIRGHFLALSTFDVPYVCTTLTT